MERDDARVPEGPSPPFGAVERRYAPRLVRGGYAEGSSVVEFRIP